MTTDELFTLIRETLVAQRNAGYAQGRKVFCDDSRFDEAVTNCEAKEKGCTELTVRMWQRLYEAKIQTSK